MDVRLLKYAMKANASRNVYIGRGEKARGIPRSPLSNPFYIKNWKDDKARDESVEMFRVYLWKIMKNPSDPRHESVWNELRKLREDSILLCYCYPRNCHGHVIVAAWNWAVSKGLIEGVTAPEPPLQQTMTNAADLKKLETQARANLTKTTTTVQRHGDKGKDRTVTVTPALMPKHIAPGPLPMEQITTALMNARLDEQILETHAIDCDDCQSPEHPVEDTLMADDVSTTPATPPPVRTTKRPRLSFDEPRSLVWNKYDDATADMAEVPMLAA